MKKKLSVLLLLVLLAALKTNAQCGLDIMVVNDQSGSVDATENAQSRDFILKLAQAHALGNANMENRIAISEFDESYFQYSFPAAGMNYTTNMADIIKYKNAVRTVNGGTDVSNALLNGYQDISQTPVTGRNVRKVLLIMTDASPSQATASLVDYANDVKSAGGVVSVVAIGDATGIPYLAIAATPGLYFTAADYATLSNNAAATINSLLTNACTATAPGWDLSISINSFDCSNNTVSYTVTNPGSGDFSGSLQTVFYNSAPSGGASLLAVDARAAVNIAAGGSQSYTFTSTALQNQQNVAAVINLDTAGSHAITPLPYNLSSRLKDATEQNPLNNTSTVVAGSSCPSGAQLTVSNTAVSVSCDRKVTYQVQVSNTGSAVANNVVPQLITGDTNLVLVSSANNATGTTVATANMANPGTDISTQGYDGYSGLLTFPTPVNGYTSAQGATFKYTTLIMGYLANGVFSFPPVSAGSGVPYGATILSAKLTAKVGGPNGSTPSFIGGIKITNAGFWDNTTNHPGDAWAAHHTGATVTVPGAATIALQTLDVTSVAQELVNQAGWTDNSEMAFFWHGSKNLNSVSTPTVSTVAITYKPAPNITPGQTITYTYIFQDTSSMAIADTFDASVIVSSATPGTIILPDTNFTVNTIPGLYGFNGSLAAHTSDNVTLPAATGCTQTPQAITTSVSITPTNICAGPGSYVTATVTINNPNTQPAPSGITLYNLVQNLNLSGTGTTFAGEPYNFTNGLQLAQPAVLDPAYPNVTYALSGKSGAQQLPVLQLPSGSSTFQIDITAGTANFNMAAYVNGIPPVYNTGGSSDTAQDATGVTVNAAPVITWACPSPATAGSAITLNATTTGAATVTLTGSTAGTIANTGSLTTPTAIYIPTAADIANQYAALSIIALSPNGCDASYSCQVPINGVSYDYGDAPISYNLGDSTVSVAAGTTVIPNLYLGLIAPGTEASANDAGLNANGDGSEEDGLISTTPVVSGDTMTYQVRVTNNTSTAAYMNGFIDFNGSGNFNASGNRSNSILVPANSGVATYNMTFVDTDFAHAASSAYMRLRLSTDSAAVTYPFGAAPQGEVEDYLITTNVPLAIGLSAFNASAKNCIAVLNWNVASAGDLSSFTIERSSVDNHFQAIATLQYEEGKHAYTFADAQPGATKWYYRLKLTNTDGSYTYSNIAPINLSHCATAADAVNLYPNPAADNVTVQCAAAVAKVEIISLTGEVLYRFTPATPTATQVIRFSHIAPGIYLLKTTKGNGDTDVQKLIKE